MSNPFAIDRIRQIALPVQNVERAITFYRDTLGLPLLFTAPPGLAFFDCGGVRLMLARPKSAEFERPGSVLYYGVNDIAAAQAALSARGVAFEALPHVVHRTETTEVWIGFFRDSEGNLLAIMSEVAAS